MCKLVCLYHRLKLLPTLDGPSGTHVRWLQVEFSPTVFSVEANTGLKTIFLKSKNYCSAPGYQRGQEKRTWNPQRLSQDREHCSVLLPARGRKTDWVFFHQIPLSFRYYRYASPAHVRDAAYFTFIL